MRKYLVPVTFALVAGLVMGMFLLKQYDGINLVNPIFNENEKLYFIQQGVYSSKESMENNVTNQINYIYEVIDNKYYAYIGITKSSENMEKLKDYFKDLGYSIYVKEYSIDNKAFNEILGQYDNLLNATTDKATIKSICSQVLAKYEELVLVE
jgi:uncharacterized protein YneF (UPF0154 family)